ncbi:glycosyltransferase [Phreatobacter sp.]|uniref:glycosyltransferase n=1 Tax=Phreatobacter sp. TaxID=1966341 RepID=UPI003F6F3A84
MSLKLLYVVPNTGKYAGIERVVDEVASGIARTYPGTIDVDVVHLSRYPNVEIVDRPYRAYQEDVKGRIDLLATLRRAMTRQDYDLIVIPQVEGSVIGWMASLGVRRRIVLHLHGNPDREKSHLRARILFFMMKAVVLRSLAGILGTSPRQLTAFQAMMPSDAPRYWAPNPVRQLDARQRDRAPGDPIVFVNVGRFAYQKGQDILIAAFARLWAIRQDVRLKIVGYGTMEAELRSQVARLGLEACVSFEHHPENPQVPLVASDVYVSTSRWEGWSLAICEALRVGLPVLATDCDFGPSDILVDARLGRLVPKDDEVRLAEGMLHFCEHIDAEARHAGFRRDFIQRYDLDKVVGVHASALMEIAAASQSGPRAARQEAVGDARVSPGPS